MTRPRLRGRVYSVNGSWWWSLRRTEAILEHWCPRKYPTPGAAADAARRELAALACTDPVERWLIRSGLWCPPGRSDFVLAGPAESAR